MKKKHNIGLWTLSAMVFVVWMIKDFFRSKTHPKRF